MILGLGLLAAAYAYEPFPARTAFVVQDVGRNDAYFDDRETFIGRDCTSTKRLETRDGIWFAGPITCGTDDYYVFEFAIDGVSRPIQYITRVPSVAPRRLLPPDTEFRVVDVARRDAFYETRADVIGLVCRAGADMTRHGRWWDGSARCGEQPYHFFRVSIAVGGSTAPTP